MRISDWSSDVCSSDLLLAVAVVDGGAFHLVRGDQAAGFVRGDVRVSHDMFPFCVSPLSSRYALHPAIFPCFNRASGNIRSEEHTSGLQSLMRISYAVFCLKKNKNLKYNYVSRHI